MENSKKILLMYWHDFEPQDTGEHVRLFSIFDFLKGLGYTIDLFALSDMWSDFSGFEDRKKLVNKLFLYSFKEADRTVSNNNLNNFVTQKMKMQFNEIIDTGDYDFIAMVYLAQADLLKYFISDKCKKIYLFEDDLALAESYHGKRFGSLVDNQIRKLKYFDEIVYISNDEKHFYDKFLPNIKSTLIPGLFLPKQCVSNQLKKYDILFVGHDNKHNIEGMRWFFDHVYPLLSKRISIRIVGKVSTHIIGQYLNVSKAGFVDNLEDEYLNAKITICPLLQGTGMKIKILEAMSYGVPSVVTSRGADGFVDKTYFGSFVADEPVKFAEYIHKLLNDDKLYKEMSKRSYDYFMEHLSFESNKDKMLDVFQLPSKEKIIGNRKYSNSNGMAKLTIQGTVFNAKGAIEQIISVKINGEKVSECRGGSDIFHIDVPMDVLQRRIPVKIEFEVSNPARPIDYNLGSDIASLGLSVKNITLEISNKSSISMNFAERDIACHIEGFDGSESDGRWAKGVKATVHFILPGSKISVVIVSDGDPDMLDRAIKSVDNTKYDNLECIVIDSSGSDKSQKLAGMLKDKISYFLSGEYSYPEALNIGLKNCSGDFILFLDALDSISDDFFVNALDSMSRESASYSVSSGFCADRFCVEIPCGEFGEVSIFALPPCSLSGMLLSREIFNKIYAFDENLLYTSVIDFQLKILTNCQFKGVKAGNVAQYFANKLQIHGSGMPFIDELTNVMEKYHPEHSKEAIISLLSYILNREINERIAQNLGSFYRNDFYSNEQKQYLKQRVSKDGISLSYDLSSMYAEYNRLLANLDAMRNNKWYQFGLLPRKEKIKKIITVLMGRFKQKIPMFKKKIKILKNEALFAQRKSDGKINILYDATFLANGSIKGANRTGIFFVAYNILKGFYKNPKLNVFLYCEPSVMDATRRFLRNEYFNNGNIDFINENEKKLHSDLVNIDVYISPMYKPIDIVGQLDYIKKFTIIYDLIPYIFPDFFPDMKNDEYWVKQLVKYINPNDSFFAISASTQNDILRFANAKKENIHITYLGTSDNFYQCTDNNRIKTTLQKYGIPQNKHYIFSLCTIEPRKNLIFAVKGFIQFIKKHNIHDLIFVMGGTQWDFFIDKLENKIADCAEYMPYILRIGYVEDVDLSPLYSGAELVVYPSLYEGFGLPILEAMTCGTPVITSNVSSCPEVVGDAGITIDPHNIDELVVAIEKIYFDQDKRQEFIEKGLARSKTFSWAVTTDNMAEIMLKTVFSDNKSRK